MTGLDGLRGIAVLAVILYHAEFVFIPGGFLGVDIFFVLSGFLITSILIDEISLTGTVDRAAFYVRRIRRLMPALFLLLIFTIIVTGLWATDAAYQVRRDLPWALSFVLNWSYIFFDESYFINIGRPPLLQHLWSLAIEEQFYVIWPIFLILLSKTKLGLRGMRISIFSLATIGAISATAWMAYLSIKNGFPTPNDPSRVYFGTDTHSMGLLVGCATAAVWDRNKLRPQLTPDRRNFLNILGFIALGILTTFLFTFTELNSNLYTFGFLLVSLTTAFLIYVVAHPGLRLGYFLTFRPLVWLGDRSYGIYIWHWPIYMLLRPGIDVSWPDEVTAFVRIFSVLVISDLSYRFVELPIRRGELGQLINRWRNVGIPKPTSFQIIGLVTASAVLISSLIGLYRAPIPNEQSVLGLGGITAVDEDPTLAPADPAATPLPVISIPPDSDAPEPTSSQIKTAKNSLVIFGDSVVLSGIDQLKEALGEVSIDAEIGRQPSEIAERIELRRKEQRLGNDIVIHMGTNGPIARKDLEPILQELADRRRVVIVNVKVPRKWMSASNKMIDELVPLYPNVRLADWATTAKGRRGYFAPDGVHLTRTGARAFAALINETLDAP
jgi:peptidoglycan/LPS O-acetylase OafA/YrhL